MRIADGGCVVSIGKIENNFLYLALWEVPAGLRGEVRAARVEAKNKTRVKRSEIDFHFRPSFTSTSHVEDHVSGDPN